MPLARPFYPPHPRHPKNLSEPLVIPMPASISMTIGNTCPAGSQHIASMELCRAALSLYNLPFTSENDMLFGDDFNGTEDDGDWPKGCYFCEGVDGCTDGAWFNEHGAGSAHGDSEVICSPDLTPVDGVDGPVLFVGDSDIDYWRDTETTFEDSAPAGAVYNVGYGGYTCSDVMPEVSGFVAAFEPSVVVLVCGENDLGGGKSVAQTFKHFKQAVRAYVDGGAGRVISLSTKPEPDSTEMHGEYEELDDLIKSEFVGEMDGRFVFVDSYNGFLDLGNERSLYHGDGLHLSEEGYGYWNSWVETALGDGTGVQVVERWSVLGLG